MQARLAIVSDNVKHLKSLVEENLIVQSLAYAAYRDDKMQRESASSEIIFLAGRYTALHDVLIELNRAEDQPVYVRMTDETPGTTGTVQ